MSKRAINRMPDDVAAALENNKVRAAYDARPAYQQNDYVGWIGKARKDETRSKRIGQMVDELRVGGIYMGMEHPPSRRAV